MTLNPTNVNITTVGDRTITVAELLGGYITRIGPIGSFTDTLPATADILAALRAQTPFVVRYINPSGQTAAIDAGDPGTTIAFGAGMAGATTIVTGKVCTILFTPTNTTLIATLLSV